MAICSGTVTSSANGLTLTFTDTGSGYGTVTSRTLTISNALGQIVQTYSMGTNLTQEFPVTADAYWSFVLTVINATPTPYTCTVIFLANGIYMAAYVNAIAQLGCSCDCGSDQLNYYDIAELYNISALRLALGGFAIAANNAIIAANTIITGS